MVSPPTTTWSACTTCASAPKMSSRGATTPGSAVQPFGNGMLANNHWKWFHVLEDELSYRGQIRLIRKRPPPRG